MVSKENDDKSMAKKPFCDPARDGLVYIKPWFLFPDFIYLFPAAESQAQANNKHGYVFNNMLDLLY